VVLGVTSGRRSSSNSTYGRLVELGVADRQAVFARVVLESTKRIGCVTENANVPPGFSTRAASRISAAESATNGTRRRPSTRCRTPPDANGRRVASACTRGTVVYPASARFASISTAWASWPHDRIGRHGARALADQPARALRRAAADLQHPLAGEIAAEDAGVGLVEALRAPDEAGISQESAVFGLVSSAFASHHERFARTVVESDT